MLDAGKPKPHKYRAKRTEIDGIKFDSKREAERYRELKLMEHCEAISDLELQPEFVLQDKFKSNGKTIRAIKYRADFKYTKDGAVIIEDVKGMKTPVYEIKKKMFLKRYPDLEFREVL